MKGSHVDRPLQRYQTNRLQNPHGYLAKRLQTLGWMTIWKVDLGDDGRLTGAHWSADYKA